VLTTVANRDGQCRSSAWQWSICEIVKLTSFTISDIVYTSIFGVSATLDFDVRAIRAILSSFLRKQRKTAANSEPPRCNSDLRFLGGPAIPRGSQRHPLIICGTNSKNSGEPPPAARRIEPDRDGPRRGVRLVFGADH
jgi:hypothetical protein